MHETVTDQDAVPPSSAKGPPAKSGGLRKLLIGIKRKIHRHKDDKADKADAAFRAQRPGALERAQYKCFFCAFRSLTQNEVHHLDDDHHNNHPSNLVPVCRLCHPYQHIGEAARRSAIPSGIEEGHLGAAKALGLIRVPNPDEISAQDMNHLLRAIAVALSDPKESAMAKEVYGLLSHPDVFREFAVACYGEENVAEPGAKGVMGVSPADMAAALSYLTDDEYAKREEVLAPVRVLYNPNVLIEWGRGWKGPEEQRAFADPADWERLVEKQMKLIESHTAAPAAVAGVLMADAIGDFDEDEDEDEDDDDR